MKQYIKKALWIIPFVFSLNLSGQTYFFVGSGTSSTPGAGWDVDNWNTSSSASPGSSGKPADFTGAITLDFNGRYVDIADMVIDNPTFLNRSGASSVTITNSGVVYCQSRSAPSFTNPNSNVTYDFSTSGEFYYCAENYTSSGTFLGISTVTPLDYYKLTLAGTIAQIVGTTSVKNTLTFDHENVITNSTRAPSLSINQFQLLELKSTSNITVLNSTVATANGESINLSGSITDSRTTKSFPGTFTQSSTQNIQGTFYNLTVATSFTSGGDITVTNTLTTNTGRILTISSGHNLTIKSLDRKTTNAGNFGYSRINILGQLTLTENITLERDIFGSNNLKTSPTLTNISILKLDPSVTLTLNSNLTISDELKFSNSSSFININGKEFTINGVITNSNGSNGGKFKGSTASSLVLGATGTLYFNQSGSDSVLLNLTINNSKTVTLGNNLKIVGGSNFGVVTVESGATLNSNGYLTLRSHDGGSAVIGNSPGTISGTIHVETFFPVAAGRRYRFLASPVTGATATHWRENGNNNKYNGIQITGTGGSASGFDVSKTNNPSAFYFEERNAANEAIIGAGANDDGGWTAFSSGSQALTNGVGYRVLVRGDRSIDLTGSGGSTTPIATRVKVSGSYPGSSVQIPVTNSGTNSNNGINLVGNPYPSTIDWDNVSRTNVDAAYVIYRPQSNSYGYYTAGSSGTVSRYISSGQGFLVYCTSTGGTKTTPGTGSLTISESSKSNVVGGLYFTEIKRNHLIAQMTYDSTNWDNTLIYFKTGGTRTYDALDAGHIMNSGVNFASLDSNGNRYGVNTQDSLQGLRVIPLSVKGTAPGNFKIHFEDVNTFAEHNIYLVDNYTKKTTAVSDFSPIELTINSDTESYQDGRLQIIFEPKNTTSVVDKKLSKNFSIGPVPLTEFLTVIYNGSKNTPIYFEICNINGQLVQGGQVQNMDKINVSRLNAGIYFIKVSSGNEYYSTKLIK